MNQPNRTLRRAGAFAALLLTVAACGPEAAGPVDQARRDAPLPEDARPLSARFEGRCGDVKTGSVDASSETARALGAARYAYAFSGEDADTTFTVDILGDDDASLGTVRLAPDVADGDITEYGAVLMTWTPADGEPITQRVSVDPMLGDRVSVRVDVARGQESFSVLSEIEAEDGSGRGYTLASSRLLVPGAAGLETTLGEAALTPGGGAIYSLELLPDGAPIQPADYTTWAAQVGVPAWSDGDGLRLASAALADVALMPELVDHQLYCGSAAGFDQLTRRGALGPGEQCTELEVFFQNGGVGIVAGGIIVGILIATAPATLTGIALVGFTGALIGLGSSVLLYVYARTRKQCSDNVCSAGCYEAGENGGRCTGSVSCTCNSPTPTSKSVGDPHIASFDGLYFGFQGFGEYTLAQATTGEIFELQARQAPLSDPNCPGVTVNTAFAVRMGRHVVEISIDDGDRVVLVDGEPAGVPPGGLDLTGATVTREGSTYTLTAPSGERVVASTNNTRVNLSVYLPEARLGQIVGAMGTFDGDPSNEFVSRSGQALDPTGADIYGGWGESWRVDASNSLFTYADGEGPEDFVDRNFNFVTDTRNLPEQTRIDAFAACEEAGVTDPVLREGCALDWVCLGPGSIEEFSELNDLIEEQGNGPIAGPPVSIVFDDWSVEGDPTNGTWQITPDGRGVTQTANDDPTFFVSDVDYRGVTLSGTWSIANDSDDDYIGFVMGYNAPLQANGDDPAAYDMLLFDWKSFTQGFDGYTAEEGFILSRVLGTPANEVAAFWGHDDPSVTVLASDVGAGKGWRRSRDYRFVLSYSASLLRLYIDGDVVFDVTASSVGLAEFPLGRFGFYNYSQANVTYERFDALPYLLERVFHDNFEQESDGADADSFANWEVTEGAVDVNTDGPTSRVVDLDGSQRDGGTLRTRDPIALTPGTYRLTFDLGEPVLGAETVAVRLGSVYSEDFSVEPTGATEALIVERTIVVDAAQDARLSFSSSSEDNFGAKLDNVALYRVR
jgi:hypothetical protein